MGYAFSKALNQGLDDEYVIAFLMVNIFEILLSTFYNYFYQKTYNIYSQSLLRSWKCA
jgi:hypothetical protein